MIVRGWRKGSDSYKSDNPYDLISLIGIECGYQSSYTYDPFISYYHINGIDSHNGVRLSSEFKKGPLSTIHKNDINALKYNMILLFPYKFSYTNDT